MNLTPAWTLHRGYDNAWPSMYEPCPARTPTEPVLSPAPHAVGWAAISSSSARASVRPTSARRLPHAGQRRVGVPRDRRVLEADQRHVVRHPPTRQTFPVTALADAENLIHMTNSPPRQGSGVFASQAGRIRDDQPEIARSLYLSPRSRQSLDSGRLHPVALRRGGLIARKRSLLFCFSFLICCSDETSVADTPLPDIAAGCRAFQSSF
jgi:hypothetical protein